MHASRLQIASRSNPRVKQLRAAFAGQSRLAGGLVAIEGETLLFEAIRAGLPFKTVFLSQSSLAPEWLPRSVEVVELTDDVFASAVDTQAPQGIAALLAPPVWRLEDALATDAAPLLLIAAGLQDPGNLGTALRSAQALGAHAVLTTPGTVSEWNQKAVRASAGAVFSLPVVPVTLAQIAVLGHGLGLSMGGPGRPGEQQIPFGNDTKGEQRALTRRRVHLFAAVADDPLSPAAVPVAEADLTQPCALMIGNEGAGLSAELLALCNTRITIPTPGNGKLRVESLNAAVAASLLMYEASRQRAGSR